MMRSSFLLLAMVAVCAGYKTPAFVGSAANIFGRTMKLKGGSAASPNACTASMKALGVGDVMDGSLELLIREDGKTNTYTTSKLFAGKQSVIFAVPGAFTPTCSEQHLPGFVEKEKELKAAGVDIIACVSVNDPFVMMEWGKATNVDGKVMLLSDGNGSFSKAIGQLVDKSAGGMGMRSNRFAMVLDSSMKVEMLALEKGGFGETSADAVLKFLKA